MTESSSKRSGGDTKLIVIAIACFLLTMFLMFFLFLSFKVEPLASGILGLVGGTFIVFVIMGLSGIVRELAIKSPFFEISSTLVEKVATVQNDVNQARKDVANVNENVRAIQQNIQTLMLTNTVMSSVRSDITIENIMTKEAEKAKEITKEELSVKGVEKGFDPDKKTEIGDEERERINRSMEKEETIRKIMETLSLKPPPFDIGATLQKANYFYYQGNYEKALELYDLVLKYKPNEVNALLGKSFALSNLGKFDEGMSAVNAAENLEPTNPGILIAKGAQLHNHGKFQEALTCYEKFLQLAPNDIAVMLAVVHELTELQKYKEANDYVDKILSLRFSDSSELANAYFLKGWILYQLENEKESQDFYEKALKADPNPRNSVIQLHRAVALAHLGRYEDALSYIRQSSYTAPENPFLPFSEARIYLLQGKRDLALDRLRKAIKMRPIFKEAMKREREFQKLKDDQEFIRLTE